MAFSDIYFKSKDIKVFPSSFRGTYETSGGSTLIFDPEARLNTESNYICPKTTSGKDSYIVSADTTSIKFVLGGYYFELNSLSDYKDKLKGKYIGLKLRSVTLKEGGDIDTTRATKVLDSWEPTSENILDFEDESEDESVYYFSGLKFGTLADLTGNSARIKLLDDQGNLNKTYLIPNLQHGTGENTLLHGEGLKAASSNQTVFGKYNDNKTNTVFEIGVGTTEDSLSETGTITQKNRKNAFEVYTDETVINTSVEITSSTTSTSTSTGALTIAGGAGISENLNIGGNANLGSKLVVKTTPTEAETNVKVDGTLNVTGKTTVYSNVVVESNKTTLGKPVEITDASNTALVVSGKTTVKKDLEVGDTTKVLMVKNSPSASEQNVIVTGTLKATDKATFENGLEVASGKATTLGGQVDITGAVNVNTSSQENPGDITIYGDTTITGDTSITGNTSITGTVTITGKATSTSTTSEDAATTLTTKDYVDTLWKLSDATIKEALLNAIYPINSIYTSFTCGASSQENPSGCPIANTLGGTWERIKDTFLYAVADNTTVDGTTTYGSNDAILVKHDHIVTVDDHSNRTLEAELSTGEATIKGNFAMRTINREGASAILSSDGTVFKHFANLTTTEEFRKIDTIGDTKYNHTKVEFNANHKHTIDGTVSLPTLTHTVTVKKRGESGTGKNMPKHMYVYMWKRTS